MEESFFGVPVTEISVRLGCERSPACPCDCGSMRWQLLIRCMWEAEKRLDPGSPVSQVPPGGFHLLENPQPAGEHHSSGLRGECFRLKQERAISLPALLVSIFLALGVSIGCIVQGCGSHVSSFSLISGWWEDVISWSGSEYGRVTFYYECFISRIIVYHGNDPDEQNNSCCAFE